MCGGNKSEDNKFEKCAIVTRVALVLLGIVGLIFSCLTVTSCDFADFSRPENSVFGLDGESQNNITGDQRLLQIGNATAIPSASPSSAPTVSLSPSASPSESPTVQLTAGSVGFFKYNFQDTGCATWPDDVKSAFDGFFEAARYCAALAPIFAAAAFLLVWIDFVCCRFCGARTITFILMNMAILSQAITFIVFASDVCDQPGGANSFSCDLGQGGIHSLVAFWLFLICNILICIVPRPKPFLVYMQNKEENDPCCVLCKREDKEEDAEGEEVKEKEPNDPCCWCFRKKKDDNDAEVNDSQEFKDAAAEPEDGEDEEAGDDFHESVANIPQDVVVVANTKEPDETKSTTTDIPDDVMRHLDAASVATGAAAASNQYSPREQQFQTARMDQFQSARPDTFESASGDQFQSAIYFSEPAIPPDVQWRLDAASASPEPVVYSPPAQWYQAPSPVPVYPPPPQWYQAQRTVPVYPPPPQWYQAPGNGPYQPAMYVPGPTIPPDVQQHLDAASAATTPTSSPQRQWRQSPRNASERDLFFDAGGSERDVSSPTSRRGAVFQ